MRPLLFLAIVLTLACGRHEDDSDAGDDPDAQASLERAQERVTSSFLPDGWIVCRKGDAALCLGDSLIFTGIALGVLDCARAAAPEAGLLKMLADTGGHLYRHPTIPDEWSLDGVLGFYWGIAKHTARCPETRDVWRAALFAHKAAMGGALPLTFGVVLDQVLADLGGGSSPTEDQRGQLGATVAGWAFAVVEKRAAAYRLHLGFLALDVVPAPNGKAAYCASVREARMPLLEHFCGRPGLAAWVDGFVFNQWEYAHQRSPVWEGDPDGGGRETAGLDLILALRMLYP